MIAKVRSNLVEAVGALVALISVGLAGTAVVSGITAVYGAYTDGSVLKPALIGVVTFVLALFTRFLATLDEYEWVVSEPATRRRTTTARRRTTR